MIIIFTILAVLFAIESSTSLARRAGYTLNDGVIGMMLQSSLALFSRLLMFVFFPYLGVLADRNQIQYGFWEIIIYFSITILLLGLLILFRQPIERLYLLVLNQIKETGSFFIFKKKNKNNNEASQSKNTVSGKGMEKKFRMLYAVHILAYVPYYLAWPIVIILLGRFHEQRAMIIGLSSIFNGINTIILTLFIDPKLAQLGKYNLIIQNVYLDLTVLRFYSSILALALLSLFLIVI